jgi:putative tryptophan/tyrosine transport system substrate-binding protein
MNRRSLLRLVVGAVAWPVAARGQKILDVRHVAVLMSADEKDPEGKAQLAEFVGRLAELGWSEGHNLRLEVRWSAGNVDQIGIFARELVASQPDVILASSTPVTAALHRETQAIPVVFVVVSDPVGDGFAASLAHPGGNMTGFLHSESGMGAKMLQLLNQIAPDVKRVSILFNPDTAPGGGTYYLRDLETAAQSSQIQPTRAHAKSDADIEAVLTSVGAEPGGGLIVLPDPFMFNREKTIVSLAARTNVPAIYPWKFVVTRDGGLLSYGPDLIDIFRRGAPYVDQVLRGVKPADLPVQVPIKFEMAVNARTAKALGLAVPLSITLAADEVIE